MTLKHLECNYVDFWKNYKCKHSLGIALLQKKVDCPPEAKNFPIGKRRQRGRPKKIVKHLWKINFRYFTDI